MYARSYKNDDGYNIPANYSGNAFAADMAANDKSDTEPPIDTDTSHSINNVSEAAGASDTSCEINGACDICENPLPQKLGHSKHESSGIIHRLLSRFERGFKLDDLLLIGLILLLSQTDKSECENNTDELVLILVLVFVSGF